MATYSISTEPADVNLDLVHQWLATDTYWARGRSREKVAAALAGSIPFSALDEHGVQVGFARAVTDRATFAWLCDVYVAPPQRGEGVGLLLAQAVVSELEPYGLTRIVLATHDAHGLYERVGFTNVDQPGRFMVRETPRDVD